MIGQADYWEYEFLGSYKEVVTGDSWKASWKRWPTEGGKGRQL